MGAIIDFIFHFDKHLISIVQQCGSWTYLILFAIIFAETGLVITPFLPGDSLLFVVGTLSSAGGAFNPLAVWAILVIAAVLGDSVNYAVGKYMGRTLAAKYPRVVKKEYLDKTHKFFEKYGGKTIIIARFVPIVRTFTPFVAGLSYMSYPKFFLYNVVGGILWVTLFVGAGLAFGNIPIVENNLSVVILIIIFLSVLPAVIEIVRARSAGAKSS